MKNAIQKVLKVMASMAIFLAVSGFNPCLAWNSPDASQAYYSQLPNSGVRYGWAAQPWQSASTTSVLMDLFYNGPSTDAYVAIAAGGSNSNNCLTFYAPYNVVDTTIGTATCGQTGGTFDLGVATTNTLGALADLINTTGLHSGVPQYHMLLTGGIRTDSTLVIPILQETSKVNSLAAPGGFNVPVGTNTLLSLDIQPGSGKSVVLQGCIVNAHMPSGNPVGTTKISVYGVPYKNSSGVTATGATVNDSNQAWMHLIPAGQSNTDEFEPSDQVAASSFPPAWPWLQFSPGTQVGVGPSRQFSAPVGNAYSGHVVVRADSYGIEDATGEGAANFLQCFWTEK